MLRSRYLIIVAALVLSTGFPLLAHGEPAPPAETPAGYVNVASNDSMTLRLSLDLGVSETKTDTDTGPLPNFGGQSASNVTGIQFGGGDESSAIRQRPVSTDSVINQNLSSQGSVSNSRFQRVDGYQSGGLSIYIRALQTAGAFVPGMSRMADIFTMGNGDGVNSWQLNSVSKNGATVQSGGVEYSAGWSPGNIYLQAGCRTGAFFECVK